MPKKVSRFQQMRAGAQALLDERGLHDEGHSSKWHRFLHFWVLVGRSFARNRCPVRASALAYASLLALIPMLAVVVSITSTFLKKEGEDRIDQFIGELVASIMPPANLSTNAVNELDTSINDSTAEPAAINSNRALVIAGGASATNQAGLSAFAQDEKTVAARKSMAHKIN